MPGAAPPPGTADAWPSGAEQGLRSARFRKGREESWTRLEALLAKMDRKGARSLSAGEALELPGLYQVSVSSLSLARNLILDRRLLAYLENLSFRAYIAVYGPRETLREVFRRFVSRDFPNAVRGVGIHVLASFVLMLSGFVSGYMLVNDDLNNFHEIVPRHFGTVSPSDSRQYILDEEIFAEWPGFADTFVHFANFLFRHNSKVALLCFTLSFALGVPTAALLFSNGKLMGAMVSLHVQKDLALPFIAWLSIHGVTEILAILLTAAAGLSVAQAIVLPGALPRKLAVARAGMRAGMVVLGAVMMLFIASILEGGFRQLISFTAGRVFFAFFTAIFWFWYFTCRGRDGAS
ncbi:MAG: stage II sporulation protein M [Deltaproteobacteria bacterium]|jgi:uncharacterized membrane protein SpoIIM required for sporulation|nr:stage II sporulation protein M [Deltaproteobacteria bacterium]